MSNLHFLRPEWFLALIPLFILFWLLKRLQLRAGNWQNYCDPALLPFLVQHKFSQHKPYALTAALLTGLLVISALAGPTWEQRPQPVFKQQSALVIALDLSRSMDATDISPSRLTRALLKVQDILKKRQEGQTALIVFAGDAFTVTPLTEDTETISSQVKSLTTSIMPTQGSRSDSALRLAASLLTQSGQLGGHILLITDGVDSHSQAIAAELASQSVFTSVLAVGTSDGAPIPLAAGGFFKDASGGIVVPKLDQVSLRQLALSGAGQFRQMTTDDSDINRLLAPLDSLDARSEATDTDLKTDSWFEEGPWLLLPVLLLAAFAFRRGYLALLIIFIAPLPEPAHALDWNSLWQNNNQQARQLLDNNQPKQAAETFTDAQWKAAAQYKAGDYQSALETLQSLNKQDAETLYNAANAQAQLGQYDQAIENYNKALKLDPQHADASYNREQVEKLQQQQQNSPDSQESDKDQSDQEPSGDSNSDQSQQKNSTEKNSVDKQQQPGQQDADKNNSSKNQPDDKSSSPEKNDDQKSEAQSAKAEAGDDPKDSQDSAAQSDASNARQPSEDQQQPPPETAKPTDSLSKEQQQASEQWLRRIPDDPGGLLKRKFKYQADQRPDNATSEQQW